jgi:hypothetical protein
MDETVRATRPSPPVNFPSTERTLAHSFSSTMWARRVKSAVLNRFGNQRDVSQPFCRFLGPSLLCICDPWALHSPVSRRLMTCMVALPDGTFMILNGAQHEIAGFDGVDSPNLSALLYDPSQPIGARISILNTTMIAPMYNSEATLLRDGRVLASGSDPNPNGKQIFLEELRIEVYIPPYLNQGLMQPVVTIPNTDWAYGGRYQIMVRLNQGKTRTSSMRVSLVAATSSTHGKVMGGRTIFPEFSFSGNNVCTVTAPPNSKISPPAGTSCSSWMAQCRPTAYSLGSEATQRRSGIGLLCQASILQVSDLLHANRTSSLEKCPTLLS